MKILDVREIDDCLEKSNFRDIEFDNPLNLSFIEYLGKLGEFFFYPDFSKPFFKVVSDEYVFKGQEGNKSIRMIIKSDKMKKVLKRFKGYIEKFNS